MNRKQSLLIALSIVVSAVFLVLVLRGVPVSDVVESMRAADPSYVLLGFLFATLSAFTRGVRWWQLLSRRISLVQAMHLVNVMFLGNQLPMRLGEVARSVLAKRAGVPLVTSATSIVVERLIDTLLVVLLIAVTVSQLPTVPAEATQNAALLGLLALVGFSALLVLARLPKLAYRLLDRVLKLLPFLGRLPLKSMLGSLLDGLQPLTQLRTLAYSAFWTGIAWWLSLLSSYFLHLALGIEVNFALSVPLGIALAALSLALPVSVAALGPFEAAILFAGQLVGMSQLEAISLGFLLHGIMVISAVLWGAIGMLALGVSPAFVFSEREQQETNDA